MKLWNPVRMGTLILGLIAVTAGPAKSSLLPSAGESAVDRYDNLYVPTNYRVLKITDPAGWARGEPTPPPLGSPTSPAS